MSTASNEGWTDEYGNAYVGEYAPPPQTGKPVAPQQTAVPDPATDSHTALALSALMAHFDCPSTYAGYIGVYIGLANGNPGWFECADYEAGTLYRGARTITNPSQATAESRIRKVRPQVHQWQGATGIVFVEATEGEFSKETGKQGKTQIRVPCLSFIARIREAITAGLAADPDLDIRAMRKLALAVTARIAKGMGRRAPRPIIEKEASERTGTTMLKYLRCYGSKALGEAIEPGKIALTSIGFYDPDYTAIPAEERDARLLAAMTAMFTEAERRGLVPTWLKALEQRIPAPVCTEGSCNRAETDELPTPGIPWGVPAPPDEPYLPWGEPAPPDTPDPGIPQGVPALILGDHSYSNGMPDPLG